MFSFLRRNRSTESSEATASTAQRSDDQDLMGNGFLSGLIGSKNKKDPDKHRAALDGLANRLGHLDNALSQTQSDAQRYPQHASRHLALTSDLTSASSTEAELLESGASEREVTQLTRRVDVLDKGVGDLVHAVGTILQVDPDASASDTEAFADVSTLYINGAYTGLSTSMAQAQDLANLRNSQVGLFHNNTGGALADLREGNGQRNALADGRTTDSVESQRLADATGGLVDDGRSVDLVSHSQGGLFSAEALRTLGDGATTERQSALDEQVHLTLMGSALDDKAGHLPEWFDHATFIDEQEDLVARTLSGRGHAEQDDFTGLLEHSEDERGDIRHFLFDDATQEGAFGMSAGAHDWSTYLGDDAVRELLQTNPHRRSPTTG